VVASGTASAPLRYDNPNLRDLRYFLQAFGLYENDRTARFFGIGANSGEQDETNYSLDSQITPIRGRFGQIFIAVADEAIGSDALFVRYVLEGLWLWPHLGECRVLAVRGLLGAR
jgi:hypothetical protein